jgi:hypothetical protein
MTRVRADEIRAMLANAPRLRLFTPLLRMGLQTVCLPELALPPEASFRARLPRCA